MIQAKRNIAIVAGGDSSEWEVSLRSAQGLMGFIPSEKYNRYVVVIRKKDWHVVDGEQRFEVDKRDFSFVDGNGQHIVFDFAYITVHGTPGENGILQGYFSLMQIPFSTCGVAASSLTFDKFMCNHYLKSFGINIAKSIELELGKPYDVQKIVDEIGLPCFVKPTADGSSFGVSKVKTLEALKPALEKAFSEKSNVMVEAMLVGTEVTSGMYQTKHKQVVFPITEVVTSNEFFDYDAKYNGQVDEITPARVSQEMTREVQMLTAKIYNLIHAKGIIRIDYIIAANGTIYLLEVNTTPGMTATSFIPQQVRAANLDIADVMCDIIENEFEQ
ncbi:MAG: D-alanine--D-alanine ligase [Bacteroidales bacterium]|nr:D-alanine--D-alanine ligase [Bacteroidales bacterium]